MSRRTPHPIRLPALPILRRGTLALGVALAVTACGDATAPVLPVPTALRPDVDFVSLAYLGQEAGISVEVVDQDGGAMPGVPVVWRSNDPGVVTVSSAGRVTAVSEGAAVVTAEVGSIRASVPVEVRQIPSTLEVSPATWSFAALGDTLRLTARVLDAGGSALADPDLVWTSSDPSVASVDPAGLLLARADGTTTVSARSAEAVSEITVSVAQYAAVVSLAADSVVLDDPGVGVSLPLLVTDSLGNGVSSPEVVWESTDPSVVAVDADGMITGVATGSARVVARVGTASDTVAVRVRPELTLVLLADPEPSGTVDSELAVAVRVQDATGVPEAGVEVEWSVDAGSIVSAPTVTSDLTGHVTAVWRLGTLAGVQSATASIRTRGRRVDVSFAATAEPGPATDARLLADSVLLSARGETAFLAPAYTDVFGNPTTGRATWTSSAPAVAAVAADGLVTGGTAGSAWIRAEVDGPADSILVTVAMRGAITVTFDDGWRSVYENAWPVMQTLDLPANVAVYTEAVGWPAYMTGDHLDELHLAGWAMVSHTVTHDSLSTLSAGDLDYELRTSKAWLEGRGYRGTDVFVAPYHDFGPAEKIAVADYYVAARGTSSHIVTPDSLVAWKPDLPYDLTGIEAETLPYTTAAGRDRLRGILQRTRDEGRFVDVFFHRVPPEDVPAFQATMEVVAEFRDRVLPYDRLYPTAARVVR